MNYKMEPITDIQIDLVSNASLNSYPDNSLSSFTNELHSPLQLEGDWEVALVEIFHPTTIEKELDRVVNISLYRDVGGAVKTRKYPFNYKISQKIGEIVNNLNKEFETLNISYLADEYDNFELGQNPEKSEYNPIQLSHEKHSITIEPGSATNTGLFGVKKINFLPIFDDPSFLRCLGYNNAEYIIDILKFKKLRSKYDPIDPSYNNLLFVYTDIVREHHVGDSMSNCLRTIPLRSGLDTKVSTHTFSMPYYFSVRYGDIKNISILLTDETGTPIKFKDGRTFVTLHFRRKLYKASFG